jgi:hypothetical protein
MAKQTKIEYWCDFCPKSFKTDEGKEQHAKTVHPEMYKVRCEHCQDVFTTQKKKKSHIKTVHQFSCKDCGNKFPSANLLGKHACGSNLGTLGLEVPVKVATSVLQEAQIEQGSQPEKITSNAQALDSDVPENELAEILGGKRQAERFCQWLKEHVTKFINLSELQKKDLSIPSTCQCIPQFTSAPNERKEGSEKHGLEIQKEPSGGDESDSGSPVDESITPATSNKRSEISQGWLTNDATEWNNLTDAQETQPSVPNHHQSAVALPTAEELKQTYHKLLKKNLATWMHNPCQDYALPAANRKSATISDANRCGEATTPETFFQSKPFDNLPTKDGQLSPSLDARANEHAGAEFPTCDVGECLGQGEGFNNWGDLEKHKSQYHKPSPENLLRCPRDECSALCFGLVDELHAHFGYHLDSLSTCDVQSCNAPNFHSHEAWKNHMKQDHPDEFESMMHRSYTVVADEISETQSVMSTMRYFSHKCHTCGEIFNTQEDWFAHTQSAHPNDEQFLRCFTISSAWGSAQELDYEGLREYGRLQCKNCDKLFKTQVQLDTHQRLEQHHPQPRAKSPNRGRSNCVEARPEKNNQVAHAKSNLDDNKSNQAFRNKANPNIDKAQGHPLPKLTCNTCREAFHTQVGLDYHQNIAHGETRTQCGKFDKSFDNNSERAKHMVSHTHQNMNRHKSKDHPPSQPHTCPYCKMRLLQKTR